MLFIYVGFSIIRYVHHLIDRLGEWTIGILVNNIFKCEVKGKGCGDVVCCGTINARFTSRALHEVGIDFAQS